MLLSFILVENCLENLQFRVLEPNSTRVGLDRAILIIFDNHSCMFYPNCTQNHANIPYSDMEK